LDSSRHHLLRRQLRRRPEATSVPELDEFLDDIDRAYHQADADRKLLERSLELTSDELLAQNAALAQALDAERARALAVASHHDALGRLATLLADEIELDRCMVGICEQVCRVLDVEQTSIWQLDEVRGRFERKAAVARADNPEETTEISRSRDAAYLDALCETRALAIDDVVAHPLARELSSASLFHSATARLAAPARVSGRVVGVIHIDHVGGPRSWTADEQQFAASVADCVSLALESHRRRREEQLRVKLEADLRQRQRMDSIGMLAGGIAHDFNNLLVPILGNSELLLEALDDDHPDRELLDEIFQAGAAAKDLVSQLLAFSRKQVLQLRVVDAAEESSRVARLLTRTLPETIRLELALGDVVLPIRADPGQLHQVILNLVVNAKDAMPEGGTIRIVGDRVEIEGVPHVSIAIEDSGIGMDEATLTKIFEPFFTTKSLGRGTGLGLSTAYGIVEQHGGTLRATSALGRGSRFEILLPMEVGDVESQPVERRARPGGDGLVVLVVEDEPIVLGVVRRVLQSEGYSVFHAGGPEEAIAIARRHPEISLIVTDVMMPVMNGARMFEEIQRDLPHVRVLYMSGYDRDVLAPHGILASDVPLLRKPFANVDLVRAVRQALAGVTAVSTGA